MESRDARQAFRHQLLPATVANAAERIAAYRTLWNDHGAQARDVSSLQTLPLVRKSQMQADPEGFWDKTLEVALVQHTTGTTGRPLLIRRSVAELEFIDAFFAHLNPEEHQPLVISPSAEYHGTPTPVPYRGRVFSFNQADRFWDVALIASRPWELFGEEPGPVLMVGLEVEVRQFTMRLVEEGFDFATSAVKAVLTTGDLVTTRRAKWYEATWGVPIISRFGLTEAFGGASPCRCGFWHFDPLVLPEVVDPFSQEPIESGCGLLVITCLHPFVQQQPFIRYVTGDLVRLGPRNCPVDTVAFRPLGRVASSVLAPDRSGAAGAEPLIAGNELFDILDGFADVASTDVRVNIHGQVRTLADRTALGPVRASVEAHEEGGRTVVDTAFETRYSSYLYADAEKTLLDSVKALLMQRHPRLAAECASGTAVLNVRAALPGTLAQFRPDEPE